MKLRNGLFALALALGLGTAVQAQETVRIASEGAYAPWNFTNARGELDGFEVELARDLCQRMGVECELMSQAWDGIIPALQAGKYDAIMAGMAITPERQEVIDFTRSYATTPQVFVVPKDSELAEAAADMPQDKLNLGNLSEDEQAQIDKLAELLDGMTVGVQTATINENLLREYMPNVDISTYDTQENLDLDMQSGRIDAGLADQSGWQPLLKSEEGENFTIIGPRFTGGLLGEGVGVGLRKEDTELKEKFNAAIEAALEDGTVQRLSEKWFGFDTSASTSS